jgi:hypothetical protein
MQFIVNLTLLYLKKIGKSNLIITKYLSVKQLKFYCKI